MRPDHSTQTYSRVAIILHWVMALGIVALAAMGLVMTYFKPEPMRLFQI
jgi:cytochrome b561